MLIGENLMTSTFIPEYLTVDQVAQYQELVDANALRVIDEGIGVLLRALEVARDMGIVTDFTYKTALLMHELRPDEYQAPARLPVTGQVGEDGWVLSGVVFEHSSPETVE